jgi:hypothetical protein
MSRTLVSQINIDAPPVRVWQVLTDLSAYPDWNPFIVRAEGRVDVGSRLTLRMQPAGGRPMTLKPTVVEAVEGSSLRWRGTVGIPGLLDAEHVFRLTERNGSGSTLHQDEHFHGLLVPLMTRSLHRKTLPAFVAMNEALRLRAEQVGTAVHG